MSNPGRPRGDRDTSVISHELTVQKFQNAHSKRTHSKEKNQPSALYSSIAAKSSNTSIVSDKAVSDPLFHKKVRKSPLSSAETVNFGISSSDLAGPSNISAYSDSPFRNQGHSLPINLFPSTVSLVGKSREAHAALHDSSRAKTPEILPIDNKAVQSDNYYDDYGTHEYKDPKNKILRRLFSCNIIGLIVVILCIVSVFVVLPFALNRKSGPKSPPSPGSGSSAQPTSEQDIEWISYAANNTSKGQPLVPKNLPIDPDTPASARVFRSSTNETWSLVFSDEFNQDGRTFAPGEDPVWEAQDFHYWATEDLEYYHPKQATTKGGSLLLTIDQIETEPGLNYTSGMVNSWNKFCFQGGYLEVRTSFAGDGKAQGFWPAAWTLGNLGRAGFGASTDGLWPYTYNSCDNGVLVNQTNSFLSKLPGQRLNACVCSGDHPSPGIGRGAPEIDIFEGAVRGGGQNTLSMSLQVAPFDFQYISNASQTKIFSPGKGAVGTAETNSYTGGFLQQSVSAVHTYDPSLAGGDKYGTFGFEYLPGPDGYVQWYAEGKPVYRAGAGSIGPNPLSRVSQRVISEEPMYILMNLGLSPSWSYIDLENLKFPASLKFDYVRLYQHPDRIKLSCDPSDRPTADYIMNHPRAYYNKDLRLWEQTGYGIPSFDVTKSCKK